MPHKLHFVAGATLTYILFFLSNERPGVGNAAASMSFISLAFSLSIDMYKERMVRITDFTNSFLAGLGGMTSYAICLALYRIMILSDEFGEFFVSKGINYLSGEC